MSSLGMLGLGAGTQPPPVRAARGRATPRLTAHMKVLLVPVGGGKGEPVFGQQAGPSQL